MIQSMTGFGRSEIMDGERKFLVEIKGVNHRYLDINIRMPRQLNFLETNVRNLLKERLQRGKVDLYISYEDLSEDKGALRYNEALAGEYLDYLKKIGETFHLEDDIRVSTLSRYPEVITMEDTEIDEEEVWNGLKKALDQALDQFIQSRISEGENLRSDILGKLDEMSRDVDYIKEREPQVVDEYREKLRAKVGELLEDDQIDESRLAAEVVLYADKICTDEEVVRLTSHIEHMKETLESDGEGIGRKLDFITQEMNREANTILSKANDLATSDAGIDLKTGIEKIREQIQNIE